jgi:hypothetical protein
MPYVRIEESPAERQQKAVVRSLTLTWLVAIAYSLACHHTRDLTGGTVTAPWHEIAVMIGLATAIYLPLLVLAIFAWRVGRVLIIIASFSAGTFLVAAVGLMGLFAAWAYDLTQYLLLVVLTCCVLLVARRCSVMPKPRK